jgi:thiamine transport system substrate-binding protein
MTASACGNETEAEAAKTVKLVTHGSFALSEEVLAAFTNRTGLEVEVLAGDDAGAMVNQLILSKDAPVADAVFGIDNTLASRAIDEGILEPYKSPKAGPEQAPLAPDQVGSLSAIDSSDVCVNADLTAVPDGANLTFEDLLKPEHRDQLVVEDPTRSSPGLAFLLATIAYAGEDGWVDYWLALKDNGVKIASGWEEAYYTEFSGPSSEGSRPLVVSYASSPPSEIPEGASEPVTAAALDTCFRQVEYAGVLRGAANPAGARQLIDFLLGQEVQADLPTSMWVYPVQEATPLPADWAAWAPLAASPWTVSPEDIAQGRERWLQEFTDSVLG